MNERKRKFPYAQTDSNLRNQSKKRKLNLNIFDGTKLFQDQIYSPIIIERKFENIENKTIFRINEDDVNIFSEAIKKNRVSDQIPKEIITEFMNHLSEFDQLTRSNNLATNMLSKGRLQVRKSINLNILKSILEKHRNQHISIKKIIQFYKAEDPNSNLSYSTCRRIMRKELGMRFKKPKLRNYRYFNVKSKIQSVIFLKKIADIIQKNETIIYIDESSFNNHHNKFYNWIPKNLTEPFPTKERLKSISLILAVSNKGIVHKKSSQNTTKAKDIKQFIFEIIEKLSFEEKRKTWIYLDNACVHTAKETQSFCRMNNVQLLYGIPYRPEFCLTEMYFSLIKSKFYTRLVNSKKEIEEIIDQTLKNIPEETIVNYWRKILQEYEKESNNLKEFNYI